MRRVLMISPHFPPDTTAATHRVRLLAPHLEACGWRPTVLTIDPRDDEGGSDPELAALVPDGLDVVRCRAWPAAITRRFGIGDLGLRSLPALRRRAHALLTARRYDAVFITIFPAYPALLGPSLKQRFGAAFVLDYQDPWVGSWGREVGAGPNGTPDVKSRVSRWLAERLEPVALAAADGVTAVSAETYEAALQRVNPRSTPACATLPIGWDAADMAAAGTRPNGFFDPCDGKVHFCYVGTFLPHGGRVVEPFFAALRQQADADPSLVDRLRLWFIGTSNQTAGSPSARVLPLARRFGLDRIVHEHPLRIGYLDALRVLRDASIILLAGSTEPHYTASKIFPALLAQRPLLALYHDRSSVVSILGAVGRSPSIQVVPFGDGGPDADRIGRAVATLIRRPVFEPGSLDMAAAEPYSARAVASTLAALLDRVHGDRAALPRAV